MKLTKLHLFIIIIAVLLLSTLGFSIKEYFESEIKDVGKAAEKGSNYDPFGNSVGDSQKAMDNQIEKRTDSQGPDPALEGGSNYDPFSNTDTSDPLNDNDYSKTIAGLEDIVVPGRGSKRHHHNEEGHHYPNGGGDRGGDREERREERRLEKEEKKLEKKLTRAGELAGVDMSKYILKSEIVPPVCPKCPDSRTCPRAKPCNPCPPCARCPDPAFECKKVPNYNAISASNVSNILPMPRLNSFAQFN